MKRFMMYTCVLMLLAAAAVPSVAQDDADARPFIYSTYFECDATRLEEVDALMEKMAPYYDEAKEAGDLIGWGWGRHHTGGKWKRFFYGAATDAAKLMDTMRALATKTDEVEGSEKFNEICGQHVDYLWRSVASSSASAIDNPGNIGVSQYLRCNMNDEAFADEIVKGHLSKIFNAHVGEGKLTGWTWGAHQIGGEYRRLLAMRAASLEDILSAWGSIVQAMGDEQSDAIRKFTEICYAHEDYIWMIGK